MYVHDDEGIRRVERVFIGDPRGRFELPFDARIRSQMLAVGLLAVLAPLGFQVVNLLAAPFPEALQTLAAVVLGAGGEAITAVLLTRAYGRHDKPQTRITYWLEQALMLARSPKPPPPPVEYQVTEHPTTPRRGVTVYEIPNTPTITSKEDH